MYFSISTVLSTSASSAPAALRTLGFGVSGGWAAAAAQPPLTPKPDEAPTVPRPLQEGKKRELEVYIHSLEWRYRYINPQAEPFVGKPPEELRGKKVWRWASRSTITIFKHSLTMVESRIHFYKKFHRNGKNHFLKQYQVLFY